MDNQEAPRLSTIVFDCHKGLQKLITAINAEDCPVKDEARTLDVERMMERYEDWACHAGALRPYESPLSLVSCLQTEPLVKDFMLETLTDLLESAHKATEIATGRIPNRVAAPITFSDAELLEYNTSSSDSDTSTVEDSSDQRNTWPGTSDIRESILTIDGALVHLVETSNFIPTPGPVDKRLQATRTEPFDIQADVMHIKGRYPILAQKNAALVARLGEANARRRQYFKYCRDHSECRPTENAQADVHRFSEAPKQQPKRAFDTVLEQSALTEGMKPRFPGTESTTFVADAAENKMLEVGNVTSITSVGEIFDKELPFPPVPVEARTGSQFLCPYCFTFQQLRQHDVDREWRNHVFQDLTPYNCTFPSCRVGGFQSQRDWFNHELLEHRNRWVCQKCPLSFEFSDGLKAHITQSHAGIYMDRDIPDIVDYWKRAVDSIRPDACPFCEDESWAKADLSHQAARQVPETNLDQFQRHVGYHLLQVALFALPQSAQSQNQPLAAGSLEVDRVMDRDMTPKGIRWIRDDCGRGWSIVSRKRITFIALAFFLVRPARKAPAEDCDSRETVEDIFCRLRRKSDSFQVSNFSEWKNILVNAQGWKGKTVC